VRLVIGRLRGRHFIRSVLFVCACVMFCATYSDIKKRKGPFWHKYRQIQVGMKDSEVMTILGPPAEIERIGGGTSHGEMVWHEGQQTIVVGVGGGTGIVTDKRFLPRMWWERVWDEVSLYLISASDHHLTRPGSAAAACSADPLLPSPGAAVRARPRLLQRLVRPEVLDDQAQQQRRGLLDYEPRKAYMPPPSAAAPGSALWLSQSSKRVGPRRG
jgi:hypothetical protein